MTPGGDAPAVLAALETAWRVEVQGRGRYFQFRRGYGRNRQARYGGKFTLLSEERQKQYVKNSEQQARRSASAEARKARSPVTADGGASLLSGGRLASAGRE